ncbi:hypothetical protein AOLI_G00069900 [Acnodon oligacanthus]
MTLPVPLKLSRIAVPYTESIVHDPAGEGKQGRYYRLLCGSSFRGTVLPGEQAAEAVIILWSCALVAEQEEEREGGKAWQTIWAIKQEMMQIR